MKLKNSLKNKIWIYLIFFTFLIILLLWFFQIIFLNSFYEYNKIKIIKNTANLIANNYNDVNASYLDKLAFKNEVCIEIVYNNMNKYSSISNMGCVNNSNYIKTFINSNSTSQTYKMTNNRFGNNALIYALKLNDENYLFVSSSLQPMDATINLLSKQLIIVSIIVIFLAFIIGYFISKRISKPIININKKASLLAKGNYDFSFKSNCNISEIEKLEETLDYAKEELKQTDNLRRELLANVSHDLKTPLTMIKGYAEMIRDLNNEEKKDENLNIIIEETDRLNLLVNDILDLSRLQQTKENIVLEHFDICVLIKDIVKKFDILKEKEGYIFELNMPDKVIVNADKKKIEQVLYNLICNAINYTGSDNRVVVNVIKSRDVLVEVKDTGVGIDEDILPFIWEKYYHSNKKHKRNKIGTGIGLSIVKNILEIHGFEYGVNSEKNKGTTFYFRIK